MTREYKSVPQYVKAVKGREVTGIFAVFGNLDSYRDRLWPGSFAKTIQERGGKILHLWGHDFYSPPIAKVLSLREVGRDELPADALAAYPEAMGGAEVTREYLPTPRADEVLTSINAGVPLQMSFGFDPVKYDFEEDPNAQYEWEKIRNVREVRLWETSDVLWGANDATIASKMPLELLLRQLEARIKDIKAGARHSAADTKLLNQIHRAAVDLGATQCKGFLEDEETEGEKSRAVPITLTLERARLFLLDAM